LILRPIDEETRESEDLKRHDVSNEARVCQPVLGARKTKAALHLQACIVKRRTVNEGKEKKKKGKRLGQPDSVIGI